MAYLSITVSHELFEVSRDRLLHEASALVARALEQPESAVCVSVRHAGMLFGGEAGAAAFVELRTPAGLDANVNAVLSRKLCGLLEREADVPPERAYLNFVDLARPSWGWNSRSL